jgi:hypothetical protein
MIGDLRPKVRPADELTIVDCKTYAVNRQSTIMSIHNHQSAIQKNWQSFMG